MNEMDIAYQLTLEALRQGIIAHTNINFSDEEEVQAANEFNAKQIADFYINISSEIAENH